jgi:4-hydroxy-tetrahydrodipicolinate reductase
VATLGVITGGIPTPIRVVQWGTGNTGTVAVRAIVGAPSLELVGVWAHNPDLCGQDAGQLVGADRATGVPVTNDAVRAIAAAPDCVSYMATDRGRHDDVVDDFCMILAAGINVVTTTNRLLVHPAGDGPGVHRRMEAACLAGGSSFFCTGVEPGFMADALVLHLTSLSRDITRIHVQEAMNVGSYRGGRWRSGLGNDVAADAQQYVLGTIAHNWMGPMTMLADGLGVTLDRVYEKREIAAAGREFTVPAGTYSADQAAALHFEVIGEVDGEPMFVIEHVYRLLDEVAPAWPQPVDPHRRTSRIRISGRPDIDVDVVLGGRDLDAAQQGVLATVMRAVNAIPVVCAAEPGMYSPLDLPLITGQDTIRHIKTEAS